MGRYVTPPKRGRLSGGIRCHQSPGPDGAWRLRPASGPPDFQRPAATRAADRLCRAGTVRPLSMAGKGGRRSIFRMRARVVGTSQAGWIRFARKRTNSMRVVVVGTSGAGKTSMATAIASALALPHIELDRLHWERNWEALSQTNPDEFVRRVSAAIAADAWVCDGNYGLVRDLIWRRATTIVWLDYSRAVIMYRVIKRSVMR